MGSPKGFTLIELLVVITIVGILLAMGIPIMTEYIQNARLRAVASELRDGLTTARIEAIRRNTNVTITIQGAAWEIASAGRARTSSNSENSVAVTYTAEGAETGTVLNNVTTQDVTFGSDGRTISGSGDLSIFPNGNSSECKTRTGGGEMACMQIRIRAGGIVRMCNPAISKASDPQGC